MNSKPNKIFPLKVFHVILVAVVLAVIFSAIDQFIWNNDFSWLMVMVGFSIGALLMFLGTSPEHY